MSSSPRSASPNAQVSIDAEAAILTTTAEGAEALAVIYDQDDAMPEITVQEAAQGVFTVMADGQPVAIVASAAEAFSARDVLLVERVRGRCGQGAHRL